MHRFDPVQHTKFRIVMHLLMNKLILELIMFSFLCSSVIGNNCIVKKGYWYKCVNRHPLGKNKTKKLLASLVFNHTANMQISNLATFTVWF